MNSNTTSRSVHSSRPSRLRALALAHLFVLAPLLSPADITEGPYTYVVSDGQAIITSFDRSYSGALSITNEIGGFPVTVIGTQAFRICASITDITIPNSVTNIGDEAFYFCTSLTSITIPDSVVTIGDYAFLSCTALTNVTFGSGVTTIGKGAFTKCASFTDITIPGNVIVIGDSAFTECAALTNVVISNGVTTIGGSAFVYCPSLKSVAIPGSVTNIGYSAFAQCTSLIDVTIPDGITDINYYAFFKCTSLTNIVIPGSVTNIGGSAFYECTSLTNIIIPDAVTHIGDDAFQRCTNLTSVTLGNGVTHIGEDAFEGCANLISIPIPDSVINIGDSAFAECTSLTNVIIPDNVATIGGQAFYECASLANVTLGSGVTNIGDWAFVECTSLTNITVSSSNPKYADIEGVLFNKSHTTLLVYPGGLSAPYTIPDSVTHIGYSAFYECTSLTGVTIPDSVTNIDNEAFFYCTSFTDVTIPGSVTHIGESAFASCTNLTSVTIGNGVIHIGDGAFNYCLSLTSVTIPDSVTHIGSEAFRSCTALADIIIPDSVTTIGGSAFNYCTALADITIPDSVTTIGNAAFYYCTSLTDITIPDSVTTIDYDVFAYCTNLVSVMIGNGITKISYRAFWKCSSLATVIIGNSVTYISDEAFGSCNQLTGVYFYGDAPGTSSGNNLFSGAPNVTVYRLAGKTGWPNVPDHWKYRPTALWSGSLAPPPPPVPDTTPDVGYLCAPEGDAALTTVGTYDGYFYAAEAFGKAGEASAVHGTFFLKVTGLAGKLTAKATLQGGNVSFKGKLWNAMEADGTQRTELTASGGEKLDLFVRQNRIWGTLTGGKAGAATLELDGARNRFADRGDTEAAARLETFMGYYTIALPAAEDGAISAATEVDAAPRGTGYLTVTVRAKGKVKIAGILADGTKVSRSSRLILFDDCGPEACVPLFAPLYSKKGWTGGLLWIDPKTRIIETDRGLGWFIRWENPGRTGPDGFSLLLDACGGFYGTGAPLAAAYLFGAETDDTAYFDAAGETQEWAVQPEAEVTGAGNRLRVAKSAKPQKVSEDGEVWYEYDEKNPANASFSFAARTGIFKGKFRLYCDYEDEAGKLIHKTVNVPYAGVLTPLRGEAFDDLPVGLGYCLIPDNDPAVKAFRLKRSRLVWLEEQQ